MAVTPLLPATKLTVGSPVINLVRLSHTLAAAASAAGVPVIARADLYPLFEMFNGQVELLTDWAYGDPNVLLLNSLKFHADDGQRVKEALFSNHNAGMLLEVDGPSLVGRSSVTRGVAKKIAVESPLRLEDNTLKVTIPASIAAATAAEYRANSAPTKMLTPGAVWGAGFVVGLTDAATITADLSLGLDFVLALTVAGRTMANPIGAKPGQKGQIIFYPIGTGSITTWGAFWKFPGGIKPTFTPNGADILSYWAYDSSNIFCTFGADFK